MAQERNIFLTAGPGKPVDCPLAPPASASIPARTLHRACLILGGVDRLAAALGGSREDAGRWMRDEAPAPEAAFLKAVEVILLYLAQPGRGQ